MELLLLGYILGVGVCITHDYFVIKPKLKRLINELRTIAAELLGDTTPTLIQRLLSLAELAVNEALDFEYEDPEDRYIWRELQELKQLVNN
jgi:hypothetical protein